MIRRTGILLIAQGIIAAAFIFFGSSTTRAACCEFYLEVACNQSINACLPHNNMITNWGGGATQPNTIPGCGRFTYPITCRPCPPEPNFQGVSFDGGATYIPPGSVLTPAVLGGGGCCILVTVMIGADGCVRIRVDPC
jgi:hypothetical protein